MGDLCKIMWCAKAGLFRSREILILRHQLNVLRRLMRGFGCKVRMI
jgi:hypothetical protein